MFLDPQAFKNYAQTNIAGETEIISNNIERTPTSPDGYIHEVPYHTPAKYEPVYEIALSHIILRLKMRIGRSNSQPSIN